MKLNLDSFPFGRYKGFKFGDIPTSYLWWVVSDECQFASKELKNEVELQLKMRKGEGVNRGSRD